MPSRLVDIARRVLAADRAAQDGRDPAVVNLPATAVLDLHRAFALQYRTAIQQIIPVSREGLNPDAFEHLLWRDASRSGRKCERLYLIPHSGFAGKMMQVQMDADRASGI